MGKIVTIQEAITYFNRILHCQEICDFEGYEGDICRLAIQGLEALLERKRSFWGVDIHKLGTDYNELTCVECRHIFKKDKLKALFDGEKLPRYCPNCGAEMVNGPDDN